jgi:RimJ/RimL family protein N-acetyltransferase
VRPDLALVPYSHHIIALFVGGEATGLLKGKRIDLRLVEKEDLRDWEAWLQDPEFRGAFEPFPRQVPLAEAEKEFVDPPNPALGFRGYFIQKKDGTRIGIVIHFNAGHPNLPEFGYIVKAEERGHGYATEAARIIVDYLFLSRNVERVQAHTLTDNVASQKVLEKVGFKREGELRHVAWIRGHWTNYYAWSMLRGEWGEPRILKAD